MSECEIGRNKKSSKYHVLTQSRGSDNLGTTEQGINQRGDQDVGGDSRVCRGWRS